MIFSSHIITASVLTAPLWRRHLNFFIAGAVFLISLASHYLLDFIPHWDYELKSFIKVADDNGVYRGRFMPGFFYQDLWRIFLDGALGLSLLVLVNGMPKTGTEFFLAGLSILGAIFPDLLEALRSFWGEWKIFPKLFSFERKFHFGIHSSYRLFWKNHYIWGIIFQIIVIGIIVAIATKTYIF